MALDGEVALQKPLLARIIKPHLKEWLGIENRGVGDVGISRLERQNNIHVFLDFIVKPKRKILESRY